MCMHDQEQSLVGGDRARLAGKTAEEVGQTHCLPSSHIAGLEDGMMAPVNPAVTTWTRRRRREGAEPEHRRRLDCGG